MENKIHVTINNYFDTEIGESKWNITKEEPERVSVRFGEKEYSIVLDRVNGVHFEVWSTDSRGELLDMVSKDLPSYHNFENDILEG